MVALAWPGDIAIPVVPISCRIGPLTTAIAAPELEVL
jgi:hypothetical protein